MPQLFADARHKITRANQHIADVKARLLRLHKTDTAIVEIHAETGGELLKHDFTDESAFDDLALLIGDAVHNLKCALDYTWLKKTIETLIPRMVDDRAKFPVRKTIEELEGWLKKTEVDVSCPSLFRLMLDQIQPFEASYNGIWIIHSFDNRDKHRLLLPVLTHGNIDGIEVKDESGEVHHGCGTGDLQRPPYCILFRKGLHVHEKGKLAATIAVEDKKSGCYMYIPDALVQYAHVILCIVEVFERFLEGQMG